MRLWYGVLVTPILAGALTVSAVRTPAQSIDSTAYLTGRFDPASHPEFVRIAPPLASREGMYLRRDALDALTKMAAAAAREGVTLNVVSATRNFDAQRAIWDAKWNGATKVEGRDLSTERDLAKRTRTILTFSAMPGASRHHWGTDIDLNALTDTYFARGDGAKVYAWLTEHAPTFGFCQPYTAKGEARPRGHEEEKWHWSYRPVSAPLLDAYKRRITADSLRGFAGASQGGVAITEYVMGVAEGCRE
jgi:zinc D-Ala-D-Ala carboxypeptidase